MKTVPLLFSHSPGQALRAIIFLKLYTNYFELISGTNSKKTPFVEKHVYKTTYHLNKPYSSSN